MRGEGEGEEEVLLGSRLPRVAALASSCRLMISRDKENLFPQFKLTGIAVGRGGLGQMYVTYLGSVAHCRLQFSLQR